MRRRLAFTVLLAALLAPPAGAQAGSAPPAVGWFGKTRLGKWLIGPKPATKIQDSSAPVTFNWTGLVPVGRSLGIRSLNGPIRVESGSGPGVEVTGIKAWRGGDPSSVRIVVSRVGAGQQDVLICALWGSRSTCTGAAGEPQDAAHGNEDVSVEFTVRLPAGVKFSAQAVESDISIRGVTNDVKATTVNGSVIGEFKGDVNAQVDLSTVAGRCASDFPATVSGRPDPRHLRVTLGKGGPKITMAAVNGNVELRRR